MVENDHAQHDESILILHRGSSLDLNHEVVHNKVQSDRWSGVETHDVRRPPSFRSRLLDLARMQSRTNELETIRRCVDAALGQLAAPAGQREANVFRLAAMILGPRFPAESGRMMSMCDRYFAVQPSELLESAQVVRNRWVVSLPRLRDALERELRRVVGQRDGERVKVFLDDQRRAPPGWLNVRWPDEAIALLAAGSVDELSLDHDLGDDARGTGYDVIVWIEEAVATTGFEPPKITVHSANPSAVQRMQAGINAIERLVQARRPLR